MIPIIALALSIIVMLGGLLLLARSKKDSLGNLYIFSSYAAIGLGALMFAGTVIGGACMVRHHHMEGNSSCYSQSHGGHGGMAGDCQHDSHCSGQCMSGHHGKMMGGGCMHGEQGSCMHGGMHDGQGMGCKMHKKMIVKTIIDDDDEEEEAEETGAE